jgi:hypothetical protein
VPTVAVYVPASVANSVAQRWRVRLDEEDFPEVIRMVCAEALDDEAGIARAEIAFDVNCDWARLHRDGRICRHCHGS